MRNTLTSRTVSCRVPTGESLPTKRTAVRLTFSDLAQQTYFAERVLPYAEKALLTR